MKKWVFWLIILLLLGYGYVQQKQKIVNEKSPETEVNNQAQEVNLQKNEHTIKVTKDQVHQGNLLLVNKDHPVPSGDEESEAVNLSQHQELVQGFIFLDNTIRLSPSLLGKFSTMIRSAENDGVNHFLISSGYRDKQEQNQLYQDMGAEYALPAGYSEHNLGLSLDIGSTQAEMNQSDEGKWLKKNAWNFGFILRYPRDKTSITGIQFEPWHFRYVGMPHSAIMQAKNLVLEQYLEYLKEQKTLTTTIDDKLYKISYYPVSKNTTIPVPAKGHYEISGNNIDGVIVTSY
jgi:D-alanyl-D-alanine carboxypeptidase